jgi:hypothetical protein
MNAAECIVESYFRYVRGVFTRTCIKGVGQVELDIVGVDPATSPPTFFHIESSVSISSAYSRITDRPFSLSDAKKRGKAAGQRRTAGFLVEKKFYSPDVLATLKGIGCKMKCLKRVVVSWEFDTAARKVLEDKGIECLTLRQILQELADRLAKETRDIDSEILRSLQLFVRSDPKMPKVISVQSIRKKKRSQAFS